MKTLIHKTGKKSEALISAIIVLALVLAVVAVMHLRARGFRDTANMQLDTDKAYSLAKSGVGIGKSFIPSGGSGSGDPCSGSGGGVSCDLIHKSYDLAGGNSLTIDIDPCNGTLTSSGKAGKSVRLVKNSFPPVVGGTGDPAAITWAKSYNAGGQEKSTTILKTSGGYILEGQTDRWGSKDFLIIKTDLCGNIQWAKTYGGSLNELCDDIMPERIGANTILEVDDGFVITKATNSEGQGSYDFILFKIDKSNGNLIWVKTYGSTYSDQAHDIKDDGTGFVLAGSYGVSKTNNAMVIVKTDYNGTKKWAYSYDTSANEVAESVVPFQESGEQRYLLAGWSATTSLKSDLRDAAVIKINSTGTSLAQARYNTPDKLQEIIHSAIPAINTSTGSFDGFVVGGWCTGVAFGYNPSFFAKINSTLATNCPGCWYRLYEGSVTSMAQDSRDIYEDSNGNFYFAGMRDFEGLLLKTDYQGNFSWMRQYGDKTDSWDHLFEVGPTDSGFILGGWYGPEATSDFFAVRTDESGSITNCSTILGNDQNLTLFPSTISANLTSFLTRADINSTIIQKNITLENITVKTHGVDFNITVNDLCSP